MKRLMLVCMAVVFMFGYAGVSSAQNQPPVPPVAHHQVIEGQLPGVFTPTTPPPTGAGKQYEGQPVSNAGAGELKTPIQAPPK